MKQTTNNIISILYIILAINNSQLSCVNLYSISCLYMLFLYNFENVYYVSIYVNILYIHSIRYIMFNVYLKCFATKIINQCLFKSKCNCNNTKQILPFFYHSSLIIINCCALCCSIYIGKIKYPNTFVQNYVFAGFDSNLNILLLNDIQILTYLL